MNQNTMEEAPNFPGDIEELIHAYLMYHAKRAGCGEITVTVKHDRILLKHVARYYASTPTHDLVSAKSIEQAADYLWQINQDNTPEKVLARKIARLESELANLKASKA